MADLDLCVADAPLAETELELDEMDAEADSRLNERTPDRGIFSPQIPSKGAMVPQTEETEEWENFASHEVEDTSAMVASSLFSGTESVFGSASSGYSSLAGTCDNLSVHTRNNATHSQGKNRNGGNTGGLGFSEGGSLGGSLEDLVESFDEKIVACLGDMGSDVSELAPVQMEMGESELWHHLTGSFGTVMPVDWSKTVIRNKLFLPVIKLKQVSTATSDERMCRKEGEGACLSEDEANPTPLDMHSLVQADWQDDQGLVSLSSRHNNPNLNALTTADEVIKEIDQMMQEPTGENAEGQEEWEKKDGLPALPSPLYEDKLRELSTVQLMEVQMELERLTQLYSEMLVNQLALRDEQQFDKEVKDTFVGKVMDVQRKRHQHAVVTRKKVSSPGMSSAPPLQSGKYLTTLIPYQPSPHGTGPSTRQIQMLIKILQAIDEDSPTTPTLLTDYILKMICPKDIQQT